MKKVEKEITVAAPVEAVWQALTDAERISSWFAPEARVTPGAGGSIWMSWGPGFDGQTRIEIWEKERRLRAVDEKKPVAVEYVLEARGETTVLRLVQSFGAGDWEDEYNGTNLGWDIFLGNLKTFLERRPRATCRQAIVWFPVENEPGEALSRVRERLGFGAGPRFDGTNALGEPMRGEIVFTHPKGLVAEVENLDTRVYVIVERAGGQSFLFFCAMVYADPTPRVDVEALKQRWQPMLEAK